MKRKSLRFGKGFRVAIGNARSQVAEMVLVPGKSEGNSHNRKRYPLGAGTLLLIEHGDEHEITNTGRGLLKTLNFYVPPAYDAKGDELPAGKPGDSSK
jgi:hypothetical protein